MTVPLQCVISVPQVILALRHPPCLSLALSGALRSQEQVSAQQRPARATLQTLQAQQAHALRGLGLMVSLTLPSQRLGAMHAHPVSRVPAQQARL